MHRNCNRLKQFVVMILDALFKNGLIENHSYDMIDRLIENRNTRMDIQAVFIERFAYRCVGGERKNNAYLAS